MSDLKLVSDGKEFRVFMTPKVWDAFDATEDRARARCQKWMHRYANDGHQFLNDEQFKFEDRFAVGDEKGTRVAVYAFKAHHLRVYGALLPGTNDFVCSEIDPAKKRPKANKTKLKAAATNLRPYLPGLSKGKKAKKA